MYNPLCPVPFILCPVLHCTVGQYVLLSMYVKLLSEIYGTSAETILDHLTELQKQTG